MWYNTSMTLKMGIIVLLAQKVKFHFKKKKSQKKKQFHHHKVSYFMQRTNTPPPRKTPTSQQTKAIWKYCHANIWTTVYSFMEKHTH